MTDTPPVCNYEGSDYQTSVWEQGGREYEDRAEAIALERLLPPGTQHPESIHRAMRHSVFAGGKRLRPILCMEAGRMISGTSSAGTLPAGIEDVGDALEMLHTYSLIHDDLPALDSGAALKILLCF